MSSVMLFFFNTVELCVVTINEKPWTRAREVRRALEYNKKTADIVKAFCSPEYYAQKYEISGFTAAGKPVNWPKDSQKCNIYINEEGMYEIVFSNQKPKAKDFRRHCCNVLFPHFLQRFTNKIQEKHQQTIEEKDTQIQDLEFTNEKHQQKILKLNKEIDDLIANRHVARRGCFDNVLCFIKKNSGEVHPYYVIRCQYKQLEKHKRWLKIRYPDTEVVDKCDDPNSIHRWNRFNREVIKKPNYYKNYFRLTKKKRELLETALDVNI